MALLVIGDSHSSVFTGLHGLCDTGHGKARCAIPGVDVRHLGPYLAHSVARPRHPVRAEIRKALRGAGKGRPVLLVFGEIDCRCHLVAHADGNGTKAIEASAARLAARYAAAARSIIGRRPLGFVAPPPPTRIAAELNPSMPVVGTFARRASAARGFRAGLRAAATRLGAAVIDLSPALSDRSGGPRSGYFHDGVHADPRSLPLWLGALSALGWVDNEAISAGAALARVPPPPPPPPPPILRDDPRLVPALIDRAALLCAALGARRIALYGAGAHTRRIGLGPYRARGLRVIAILDDHPRAATMLGAAVARPDDPKVRPDAVVISSDAHEPALLERARAIFAPRGVLVVPIYDLAAAPAIPSRTIPSRSRAKRS